MSIGPIQLIIVLVIVIAIFGSKKLGNLGADLGTAIKGFKNAIKEDEKPETLNKPAEKIAPPAPESSNIIEGSARQKTDSKQD